LVPTAGYNNGVRGLRCRNSILQTKGLAGASRDINDVSAVCDRPLNPVAKLDATSVVDSISKFHWQNLGSWRDTKNAISGGLAVTCYQACHLGAMTLFIHLAIVMATQGDIGALQ